MLGLGFGVWGLGIPDVDSRGWESRVLGLRFGVQGKRLAGTPPNTGWAYINTSRIQNNLPPLDNYSALGLVLLYNP